MVNNMIKAMSKPKDGFDGVDCSPRYKSSIQKLMVHSVNRIPKSEIVPT